MKLDTYEIWIADTSENQILMASVKIIADEDKLKDVVHSSQWFIPLQGGLNVQTIKN